MTCRGPGACSIRPRKSGHRDAARPSAGDVIWRRKRYRVTQADGPERLHGEWWREAGHEARTPYVVRDYFQVEVEGGGRYWLFRLGDGERDSTGPMTWFIHGAFA